MFHSRMKVHSPREKKSRKLIFTAMNIIHRERNFHKVKIGDVVVVGVEKFDNSWYSRPEDLTNWKFKISHKIAFIIIDFIKSDDCSICTTNKGTLFLYHAKYWK